MPGRCLPLFRNWAVAVLLVWLSGAGAVLAAEPGAPGQPAAEAIETDVEPDAAVVELDGTALFRVRGTTGLPAQTRAQAIVARIEKFANDASTPADAVEAVESENATTISAGNHRLLVLVDADARLEGITRPGLARLAVGNILQSVTAFRQARSKEALTHSALSAGAATLVAAALIWLVVWLANRLEALMERRFGRRVRALSVQSFQIIRAERIRAGLHRGAVTVRGIVIVVVVFAFVQHVLGLFPWTRAVANRLAGYALDPLKATGHAAVNAIPSLIVLAILFFVTRYLLTLIRLFFGAAGRGEVSFAGFDREWADPSYKLVRVGVVALALVIAFPYIPGSGSAAFQGLSIFVGVLFSLGSSSIIANSIAGYMMIYRRAFKVGDRVQIGGTVGDVVEMRVQATHLKTAKNEEVIIPNSTILNNEVINYSSRARTEGLILHPTVGIGYETPWRQVEAMLLMAAERTSGLMKAPPPFILQRALGDFAVSYELNVHCDNAQASVQLYTELHRNILDVFNEYGVQIMTPAYEGDAEVPKVVSKDQWFLPPAVKQTGKP
jgi:small-conductance mechanosensitive channel